MRLWTLHPKYLDARGLVALWREALLAQKVLLGATRGYKHHPQLRRFSGLANPPAALASYLAAVHEEAVQRGYKFDASKIGARRIRGKLKETRGQLLYEWRHLKRKLKKRDPKKHRDLLPKKIPAPHPLFRIVPGRVPDWERVRWVNIAVRPSRVDAELQTDSA
ncbi:MAG: pyrimidine dimer DNA glycosylase/endonuclease V [Verrucomicrobiota bacterium]